MGKDNNQNPPKRGPNTQLTPPSASQVARSQDDSAVGRLSTQLQADMTEIKDLIAGLRDEFMTKLTEENRQLKERVGILEGQVASLTNNNSSQGGGGGGGGGPGFQEAVARAVDDYMERREKRHNLVLIGLEEPRPGDNDGPTPNDHQAVQDLARGLGIAPNQITSVHRHGRPRSDGRPLLTKLIFNSMDARRRFLTGLRPHLCQGKPADFKPKMYVRPDLTRQELLLENQLNADRITRIRAGEDVVIFRGEVMLRSKRDELRQSRSPLN
ncbi:MAG: hypothetical protein GY821_08555 [Gammaproteobacteria bacterium]|nr:hypothetical protein [Gammaproteobacteria bacterium]